MSIHKRKRKSGIRYLAVITSPTGKQISKTFTRKVDAEAWERQQKELLNTDPGKVQSIERSSKTLSEFCRIWLDKYAKHCKTASSVHRDKQMITKQIDPKLGKRTLRDLNQERIESWFFGLSDHLSQKTCNN